MDRIDRIANEMRRVISDIIQNDIKDPRIPTVTSVVAVKLAKDLKYAKVYVSVYGSEAEKASALLALKSSSGFIRHEIGQKMIIRYVPELTFCIDESIERGAYMSQRIAQVRRADEKGAADGGEKEME